MILGATRTRLRHDILLRTALWYAAVFGVAAVARISTPASGAGAAEMLQSLLGGEIPARSASAAAASRGTLVYLVAQSMLAAIVLSMPVAWVYALTRSRRGYQQSVVQMLVLLPMVVAGIVVLVKDSLALAFALAGIVAAVRFRNSLDDSKDAVYVFLATGIGLAAAVDVPVAAFASVTFNAVALAFWYTDFGKPPRLEGALAQRRAEHELATADDAPVEPRPGRLLVRTYDGERSRPRVEPMLASLARRWEYGGTRAEQDGTQVMEYAVILRRSATREDLLRGVRSVGTPEVIGVELE